jgi:hypothetical protein
MSVPLPIGSGCSAVVRRPIAAKRSSMKQPSSYADDLEDCGMWRGGVDIRPFQFSASPQKIICVYIRTDFVCVIFVLVASVCSSTFLL